MAIDDAFIKAFRTHQQTGDLFHPIGHEDQELFQSSTIGALMEEVYDGEVTYEQLARHGDFGLGTFNALDGEMIAFDGQFFQMKSDGKSYPVDPASGTPFAVVMYFDLTIRVLWEELIDWKDFQDSVDKAVPSRNLFYALKVRAIFDHIRVRTMPRQNKPYPPLVEVARTIARPSRRSKTKSAFIWKNQSMSGKSLPAVKSVFHWLCLIHTLRSRNPPHIRGL